MERIINEGSNGYKPVRASRYFKSEEASDGLNVYIRPSDGGGLRTVVSAEKKVTWDMELYSLSSIDTEKGEIVFIPIDND